MIFVMQLRTLHFGEVDGRSRRFIGDITYIFRQFSSIIQKQMVFQPAGKDGGKLLNCSR